MNRYVPTIAALAALMVGAALPARAQDTREAEIASQQADKAKDLKPYVPNRAEKFIADFERETIEEPSGIFPYFTSAYSGGGFTLGAGYRQWFGDASFWEIFKASYTFKNYKRIETALVSPVGAHGRWGATLGWRDAPEAAFFGLGIDSSKDNRANFRLKETYAEGFIALRPARIVVLDAGIAYEDYNIEEGRGSAPSIETIYDPITAPGLGASPTYVHTQGTIGIDWRKPGPAYARSGGFYGVTLHNWADQDDTFSFGRFDAELIQHVPILRDTWVLSFRGRMESTTNDEDIVPFFLLPSLGSGSTLRAYSAWRFRDRHSILGQAEFRWIPNRYGMDWALFYDAGKVTEERGDLDFDGLKSNWGIGVRFHLPRFTILRIEGARGSEGWNLVFSMNAVF